ncbi:hypothetical protein [Elioraea sp.]|uniref:hypothetical protein n=1 Tax=Elioraea sp. TaxID=2185103 RepID=UPI003F72F669
MTLSAEELNEAVAELAYQDQQNGVPPEPFRDTVQLAARMSPTEARMLVVRAIAGTVEPGKEWAGTPEGIARQIARAASALEARRAAVGMPIAYAEAVHRVTPEVTWLAGGPMPPVPGEQPRPLAVPTPAGGTVTVFR